MWQVPFHLATQDMTQRTKIDCNFVEEEVCGESDILAYSHPTPSSLFERTSSSSSNTSTIPETNFPQTGAKRCASMFESYGYTETQTIETPPTAKKARTKVQPAPVPVPDLEATCGEMLAQMMRASKLPPKEKFTFTSFVQRCFYLFDEGTLDVHGKLPMKLRPKK